MLSDVNLRCWDTHKSSVVSSVTGSTSYQSVRVTLKTENFTEEYYKRKLGFVKRPPTQKNNNLGIKIQDYKYKNWIITMIGEKLTILILDFILKI